MSDKERRVDVVVDCSKLNREEKQLKNQTIFDKNNEILLIVACKNDQLELVEEILQNLDNLKLIDARDKNGQTAVYWASKNGNFEILELLIEKKADVNIPNKNGETALTIGIFDD